mgnify:CR=1 FL=1
MYEPSGALVSNFPVGSSVRDVTVDDDRVYLLYPTRVEVYDLEGGWIGIGRLAARSLIIVR